MAMNSGSRSAITSVWSKKAAVSPPTYTVAPVPSMTAGTTSSRTVCNSASVWSAWGAVAGVTAMTAVSPAGFHTADATATTPSVVWSRARRVSTVGGRAAGRQVGGDEEVAVEAGPEPVAE